MKDKGFSPVLHGSKYLLRERSARSEYTTSVLRALQRHVRMARSEKVLELWLCGSPHICSSPGPLLGGPETARACDLFQLDRLPKPIRTCVRLENGEFGSGVACPFVRYNKSNVRCHSHKVWKGKGTKTSQAMDIITALHHHATCPTLIILASM